MENTLEQYQKIYSMLEDDVSRDIYLNRLNWLISGDWRYIHSIVSSYLPKAPLFSGKMPQDLKAEIPENQEIVLYGAGTIGKEILHGWQDKRVIGFCSQTKEKQKSGYCGYPVMSPEELLLRKDLNVVISTLRADEEVKQILRDGGYPENRIYSLVEYLRYEDPGQYFSPDFMTYGENEVFVDVGCCDLNSSLEIRKYCGHLKKIYAFEPDPDNYSVCLERKQRYAFDAVELLPVGAWSEPTELCFNARNDGGSHICNEGGVRISAVPIDNVIDPADKVTMLKMDIEGSELEALKGARKIIQRDKPKLAICIYHKPEDMVEIPLYIKQLVPDYRLYIRHHSNTNLETVLYAIMPE